MRTLSVLSAALSALLATGLASAQEAGAPPGAFQAELESLRKEADRLRNVERRKLEEQLRQRREELAKDDDLADSAKATAQAGAAYQEKLKADPKIQEAQKGVDEASQVLEQTIRDEMVRHPDAKAARAELAKAQDRLEETGFQERLAGFLLSEYRRRLERSPQLEAPREAGRKADRDLREIRAKVPAVAEAKRVLDEAQQALTKAFQALPEKKAYDQAQKAYMEAVANCRELAQARQAKEAAAKAFDEELQQALARDEEAKQESGKLKAIAEQRAKAEEASRAAEERMEDARRKVERDSKVVAAARAAQRKALDGLRKATDENTKDERSALAEARKALAEKIDAKMKADGKAGKIREALDEVNKKYEALRQKIRDLERKARQGAAKE